MNRLVAPALLATGALLASCGGKNPSTTPCTTNCLSIGGDYTEAMTATPLGNPVSCPGGASLRWQSWSTDLTLQQEGSALTIADYNGQGEALKGVLHDDNSVAFDPIDGYAIDDSNGKQLPGRLYFVGQFEDGTPPTFAGTHTFIKNDDKCTIKAIVTWTRKQ